MPRTTEDLLKDAKKYQSAKNLYWDSNASKLISELSAKLRERERVSEWQKVETMPDDRRWKLCAGFHTYKKFTHEGSFKVGKWALKMVLFNKEIEECNCITKYTLWKYVVNPTSIEEYEIPTQEGANQ